MTDGSREVPAAASASDSVPASASGSVPASASAPASDGAAAVPGGPTPVVVAVDGPAGSGKSSVSRAAAEALGYGYLDTGACYRALSWAVLDSGIDAAVAADVVAGLDSFDFSIGTDPGNYFVLVRDVDVTQAIREPRVTGVVSLIARVPEVRDWLTRRFRGIIRSTPFDGIVVEGRDITTVVAPDAPVRILLTASEEARMGRRSKELTSESPEAVGEALRSRDRADSRVVDFMTAADGVTTLDSTDLDFDQTVAAVVELVTTTTSRTTDG